MDERTCQYTKTRIEWIDVCKGILILLMVWGHIPNISERHGIDVTYMNEFLALTPYYICWFMQAFFILTGFTTNFNIRGGDFVKKQIKTLIVPWFCFSLFSRIFYVLYSGEGLFYNIDGINYFFLIEDYWFLSALFFSKITLFVLKKTIQSEMIICFILICMMIVGFLSIVMFNNAPNPYHYYNYLHFKDFLCMAFFIWIGTLLKRYYVYHSIFFKISAAFFVMMFVFRSYLNYLLCFIGIEYSILNPVVISHYANIDTLYQLPVYIFYVITGSFTMFYFVQNIKPLSLLSYFGKNSLVVYCAHFVFLCIFIDLIYLFLIPNSCFSSLGFLLSVLSLTLLSCSLIIKLLSYKPFSYILGKF